MKKSTRKKILNRFEKLPVYFVDSSVFLEVLFHQEDFNRCISFLQNTGYHYKLMTSTLVMGEIIKSLNEMLDDPKKENAFLFLLDLLRKTGIGIIPISSECINNIPAITDIDNYLESSDRIIFSSAITENCKAFVTLDSDFSKRLENEFNILIKRPSEA